MIKGKLKCGFDVEVPDEALDDFELLEDLAEIDETENAAKVLSVYKRLLGTEQFKALKEHLRGESGRVSTKLMMDTLAEIFELNDEAKNL